MESSLLDRNEHVYVGFYVDWLIEALGSIDHLLTLIAAAMFHLGMCLYVNGMVGDLATQMKEKATEPALLSKETVIEAIRFHADVIE